MRLTGWVDKRDLASTGVTAEVIFMIFGATSTSPGRYEIDVLTDGMLDRDGSRDSDIICEKARRYLDFKEKTVIRGTQNRPWKVIFEARNVDWGAGA